MPICFVMLGANIDNPFGAIVQAIEEISSIEGVFELKSSRCYQTTPVSPIPQKDFFNAAVRFKTLLSPEELFAKLEAIEIKMGKVPKAKDAPRVIDIDLIFYDDLCLQGEKLTIPHPRWKERLFVLYPLSDLMDVSHLLKNFKNVNNETVFPMPDKLPYMDNAK